MAIRFAAQQQDPLIQLFEKAKEYCFASTQTPPIDEFLEAVQDADRWLSEEEHAASR